ncbi:MAG: hypothetical protein V1755_15550 [Chloroflexota bacterium]
MTLDKSASRLLRTGFIPGILGGLLAFAASNVWFHYFAALIIPGVTGRHLMPDFFSYWQIDAYAGAGSGYAGTLTGHKIAGLLGAGDRQARVIPILYAFILGTTVSLIANALLLFMSFI